MSIFAVCVVLVLWVVSVFWLVNQLRQEDWKWRQGPVSAALFDVLREGDMTLYELAKWFSLNRPGLRVKDGELLRALHSWEEVGKLTRYRQFDTEKGRERVYWHRLEPDAAKDHHDTEAKP